MHTSTYDTFQIFNTLEIGYTLGDLSKWVAQDKTSKLLYLLKARSAPNNFDLESEVIASQLAQLFQLPTASYTITTLSIDNKQTDVCISKDFTGNKQQKSLARILRKPLANTFGKDKFEVVANFTDSVSPYWIDKLILFDYIINNEDRHLNNISILIDDKGQIEMAPIYDNGYSLFYNKDLTAIKEALNRNITNRKSKPFFSNHTEQIKLIRKPPTDLLPKVNKVDIYRLVNQSLPNDRARASLICKWLITKIKEVGLLK